MDRLLTILAGLSLFLIGIVLLNIRRSHIRVEYSVSWLGACVALLLLTQWRWGLEQLSQLMGVNSPPISLLLIIGGLFLMVFFRFSVIISDLKDANIALTQKIAILEYQLHSLHEKIQANDRA
jgi:hypothetical protein